MKSSFRVPLVITRFSGKAVLNLDGTISPPSQEQLTIMASVQPAKRWDMNSLPEGRRGYRTVNIYTDDELIPANQKTATQADRFSWLGVTYEVTSVNQFHGNIFNHFECVATEVNDH